jgi:hypothetical protein
MGPSLRPILLSLLLFLAAGGRRVIAQEVLDFKVHRAVFSEDQAFWPELGPGKEAAKQTKGAKQAEGSGGEALHIAILPIRIRAADYQERIPCDSCHRLSANGMEFFLENYLAERLRARFPGHAVELVAPHLPLLEGGKLRLLDYLDSLDFPWARWFDGYSQPLIYRPRDRWTPAKTASRMDRLGGLLGATHLLYPAKVWVKVDPKASNQHQGSLEWGFHLVFWNVARGHAEWALAFSESARNMDLDHSLDTHLDRSLVAAWDRMPADLAALWKAEPY